MKRYLFITLALLLCIPSVGFAATFLADKTLTLSETPEGNAYLTGTNVRISVPVPADVSVAAGTLVISEEVEGDVLIAGGTLELQAPVKGDVRAAGGHLLFQEDIAGDLVAAGGVITITGTAQETHLAGGTIEMKGGARGPVKVYGANVHLEGTFAGNVDVVASDHVTLGENTVIAGTLRYNAPQEATIPASATVGETLYTGSSSFLPTAEEAKTFALAGAGVFLIVSLISSLLAAGLVAGLFPVFTQSIADRALFSGLRKFLLLFLLGFALLVATPVLLILLVVSFVGFGVALLVGSFYLLLLALSYVYAGVLAGAALARGLFKRSIISWRFAVLGTLALQIVTVVPGLGPLVAFVLSATATGAIASLAFSFAFPRGDSEVA